MPSKSPQRLAKLARANAAKNPPLSVEYDDIEPRFPGVSAAAKSTILELMGSKGFTQDNAERIVMHYISCFPPSGHRHGGAANTERRGRVWIGQRHILSSTTNAKQSDQSRFMFDRLNKKFLILLEP